MRIALHEITTRPARFEDDVAAYAGAGWSAFEMDLSKAREFVARNSGQAYRECVRDSGLKPVACTGHVVQAFADAEALRQNEGAFADALDFMGQVECPVIVFGGDGPEEIPAAPGNSERGLAERDREYAAALERFADRVGQLADLAESRGVTMALEMNWCRLCRSVITAADVLDRVGRSNVGFLFDAAHFAVSPSRLADLDLVADRIVHGHLDDMRAAPPELWNVNNDRVIPGDGCLPLKEWYKKVEACGYKGWHAVELFCHDLWDRPAAEVAESVKEGCKKVWPRAEC